MGSVVATETELKGMEELGERLKRVSPWSDLIHRTHQRLILRNELAELCCTDLTEEETLQVLTNSEAKLLELSELPESFHELCPKVAAPESAQVPISWAKELLEKQPGLKETRFHAVPKRLKEEDFWDRYFAAVFQILERELLELRSQDAKSSVHLQPGGHFLMAAGRFSQLAGELPRSLPRSPLLPWEAVKAIGGLGRQQRWAEALAVFWPLVRQERANLIVWNSVISACAGRAWEWSVLLLSLLEVDAENEADAISYNTVLTALMRSSEISAAVRLLHEMPMRQILPDTCSFNTVMGSLAKEPKHCKVVLSMLEECGKGPGQDAQSFNIAIAACSRASQWQKAIDLLEVMASSRHQPDEYSYTSAISGCKNLPAQ
ncbi:unnamed protein product, partial [Durusdinium trenchii]